MKTVKETIQFKNTPTWEEQSGLLDFLSEVPREVDAFNKNFEFGIHCLSNPAASIDNNAEQSRKVGFILTRHNMLLPEFTYCLYSLLENKMLHAYIGMYKDNNITTLKQLKPVREFKKGKVILYDWLSQLVRASCEKIML